MNKTITATWDTEIMVPCDAKIPTWREEILKQFNAFKEGNFSVCNEFNIRIGSQIQVYALRTLVTDKLITEDELVFIYNGIKIYPSSDGRLDSWPSGFADLAEKYIDNILCFKK